VGLRKAHELDHPGKKKRSLKSTTTPVGTGSKDNATDMSTLAEERPIKGRDMSCSAGTMKTSGASNNAILNHDGGGEAGLDAEKSGPRRKAKKKETTLARPLPPNSNQLRS